MDGCVVRHRDRAVPRRVGWRGRVTLVAAAHRVSPAQFKRCKAGVAQEHADLAGLEAGRLFGGSGCSGGEARQTPASAAAPWTR